MSYSDDKWDDIWFEQSEWSQAIFGKDSERGPVGAIKHLRKETQELLDNPFDVFEYADAILLIFDAARRAGINYYNLKEVTYNKLQINKGRKWPKPVNDEPVEHIK